MGSALTLQGRPAAEPVSHGRAAQTRLSRVAARYMISLAGPVSVSASHFVASILIFRMLPAREFGLFSFVIVAVSFCLSMSGSLLGAPATVTAANRQEGQWPELPALLAASQIFAALAALAVTALLWIAGAHLPAAAAFGAYASVMCLRWFSRAYGYAQIKPTRVTVSDLVYAGVLIAGLSALGLLGDVSEVHVAIAMLLAAIVSLLAAEPGFLRRQFRLARRSALSGYRTIWHELSRWSLLGVITTEFSGNAHAYIVTLFAGPHAFALLALGTLLMRPARLSTTALGDVERAPIAVLLEKREFRRAARVVVEFQATTLLLWAGTAALAAAILWFAPGLVVKHGYARADVILVTAISVAIMLARVLRAPRAVLLQAGRKFGRPGRREHGLECGLDRADPGPSVPGRPDHVAVRRAGERNSADGTHLRARKTIQTGVELG